MPATRSLKPVLKFTLVLCLVVVLYRSFVEPRTATADSTTVANGGAPDKKGFNWSRDSDAPRPPSGARTRDDDDDEIMRGFKPRHGDALNAPKRPPIEVRVQQQRQQIKEKEKIDEVAKQVPPHVPDWVVANEIDRVENNGDEVSIERDGDGEKMKKGEDDTFKQELERMNQRKQDKAAAGGAGDRKPQKGGQKAKGPALDLPPSRTIPKDGDANDDGRDAARADRKVYHLVDEDDELDAAQRGDSDARLALAGQRKKGPLIQVGGAGNAAGEKVAAGAAGGAAAAAAAAAGGGAGAALDAVKAKGKDKWKGKGWDQRFKKQGAPDKDKEEESDAAIEAEGDNVVEASEPKKQVENDEAGPTTADKLLVQHPLVARFLRQDISHTGATSPRERSQVAFAADPDQKDAKPNRKAQTDDLTDAPHVPERHNLTVCALVPNEQRFLPEWILYHSLLGVSRFALYDTSLPGAFGGEEIDQLADSMREEGGGGENAPTVEELKAQVAVSNAGREGLDEKGLIRRERVRGLEEWIDKGRVEMFYMKFKNPRANHDVHALMLENCVDRFGPSSDWLAHLDVDEFLSLSTPLYGSDEPYSAPQGPIAAMSTKDAAPDHVYPLHDLLASPALDSALCVPVPELNYRNLGIRELKRSQGVLETQVHRDVLGEVKEPSRASQERGGGLPQKTLIHTAFSSEPAARFSGPHSCELLVTSENTDNGIRDSQGNVLEFRDGLYRAQNLPIEPLAIAHYVQRDLLDCHSKLSSVADPLSLLPKGRGSVSCEAHYLPSASELASETWRNDPANEDLKKVPVLGSVLEDRRMATSWAGRAAKTIGDAWRAGQERGMKRTSKSEREKLVSRVRRKVEVLSY